MEKDKMSTQLKFRVRAEAETCSLVSRRVPAPCSFVTLDHYKHGVGVFTQLKFRVGAKASTLSPWVKPRADAPSLSNPLNIMAAHWGSL